MLKLYNKTLLKDVTKNIIIRNISVLNSQNKALFEKNNKSNTLSINNINENIFNQDDYPMEQCRNYLQGNTIGVIGYGPQGRGQALNLFDNKFNIILGLRPKGDSWNLAIKDGWKPGHNLFDIDEASKQADIVKYLLSDAGQIKCWPIIYKNLTENKTLYFSHGFGIVYDKLTNILPPKNVDCILVAPKGPGASLREKFLKNEGINCSFAIKNNFTGKAHYVAKALGFGIGGKNLFETTFEKEVYSDLVGERCVLMGLIQGAFKAQYDVLRENGHSPSEAFNETVEEGLVSLYPMINEKGMDWMFENCSTTAQRGALDWSDKFYNILKPEINKCYSSVVSGKETEIVIKANSDPMYKDNLRKELDKMKNHEMWQIRPFIHDLR